MVILEKDFFGLVSNTKNISSPSLALIYNSKPCYIDLVQKMGKWEQYVVVVFGPLE